MLEIRDKTRLQLIGILHGAGVKSYEVCEIRADEILSIESLAIVDRDAELPENPNMIPPEIKSNNFSGALNLATADAMAKAYSQAQQEMLKAGYVLEVKE